MFRETDTEKFSQEVQSILKISINQYQDFHE